MKNENSYHLDWHECMMPAWITGARVVGRDSRQSDIEDLLHCDCIASASAWSVGKRSTTYASGSHGGHVWIRRVTDTMFS